MRIGRQAILLRRDIKAQPKRKTTFNQSLFYFELVVMLTEDPICRYMYISAC